MASTRPPFVRRPCSRALALAAFLAALLPRSLAVPSAAVLAEDSDPVVARANGVDIRQSDLALPRTRSAPACRTMGPDQKRDYLITYLADVIILAQAADQQKLGDRDDVKHRIEFERNKVLMETLLQDAGKAAVTDDGDAQGL